MFVLEGRLAGPVVTAAEEAAATVGNVSVRRQLKRKLIQPLLSVQGKP